MTESVDQVTYYCGCLGEAVTGSEELPRHCTEHGDPMMPRTWERIAKSKESANPKANSAKFGGTNWAAAFHDYQKRQKNAPQNMKS